MKTELIRRTIISAIVLTLLTSASLQSQTTDKAPKRDAKPAPEKATTTVKDLTIEETEKLLKEKKDVVVLDIRTPAEFSGGHIAGAKNIDFNAPDFQAKIAALDKSKSYIVHCAAGGRSTRSLEAFKKEKFPTVFHMKQGLRAWESAGKPLER
jgi:rhodanese-related sulfurtransferase